MLTLGIDTSNYATSLAVFDTDAGEVVCDCKKFLPVKEGQLGLRQSDALFHHTAALPEMLAELSGKADLTKVAAVGAKAGAKLVLKQATSDNATGDVFKDKNNASYTGSKVKADTYTASVAGSTVTWTGTLAK